MGTSQAERDAAVLESRRTAEHDRTMSLAVKVGFGGLAVVVVAGLLVGLTQFFQAPNPPAVAGVASTSVPTVSATRPHVQSQAPSIGSDTIISGDRYFGCVQREQFE